MAVHVENRDFSPVEGQFSDAEDDVYGMQFLNTSFIILSWFIRGTSSLQRIKKLDIKENEIQPLEEPVNNQQDYGDYSEDSAESDEEMYYWEDGKDDELVVPWL